MKKIIKRLFAMTSLACLVIVSGITTLVFFPAPLFAYEYEYEKFRVFSDVELAPHEINSILDEAYTLTEACELHDPNFRFDIFLADNNVFNDIESLLGKGPIARATAWNVVIKVPLDLKSNIALGSRSRVNLAELLAHEMVHILQTHHYGMLNFNPVKHPPYWKLEGYPEYVSRHRMLSSKGYDLVTEIERYQQLASKSGDGFVEVTKGHFTPLVYYKGRLMIEYLIDIKGMTYDEILADTRTEEEVFAEMLSFLVTKSAI